MVLLRWRGERVPLDARRASPGTARRAPKRATTEDLRLSALRSPLMGADGTETSKTRAQKCAAGTRKAGLSAKISRVRIARLQRFIRTETRAQCPRVTSTWAK